MSQANRNRSKTHNGPVSRGESVAGSGAVETVLLELTKGLADVEDQIKVVQAKTKRKMPELMNACNSYLDDEVCAVCWPMTCCIHS